ILARAAVFADCAMTAEPPAASWKECIIGEQRRKGGVIARFAGPLILIEDPTQLSWQNDRCDRWFRTEPARSRAHQMRVVVAGRDGLCWDLAVYWGRARSQYQQNEC